MSSTKNQVTLRHSQLRQPHGSRHLRKKPGDDQIIQVTVVVRPRLHKEARLQTIKDLALQHPNQRRHLDSRQFGRLHGARQEELDLVEAFANRHDLRVLERSSEKRCVVLSGRIAAFNKAFQVECTTHHYEGQTYRSYQNGIRLPKSLDGVVEAVLGLDDRSLMSHHMFLLAHHATRHVDPQEIAEAYNFPTRAKGKGQCIAIIELGGGFHESDIREYFKREGLRKPKISVVELDAQRNDPSSPEAIKKMLDKMGLSTQEKEHPSTRSQTEDTTESVQALWTIETTMDIQLAGAFANGAEIVVYFAPNNSQGKYHALTAALNNREHPATLISCSWGAVEDSLPLDFVHSLDQVFQDAVLRGITICFSSGDRGDDSGKDGQPRVHFPASSPHVLSCGGTHWTLPSKKLTEVVWSETLPTCLAQSGGGVSKIFEEPEWQSSAGVKQKTGFGGRGVPDVAGKADMATGYRTLVGGYTVTMGGTSAAAPMWAGLIARLNQELRRPAGYLTPFLYQDVCKHALSDITEGSNGTHFQALPGWDACTGLGTPNGKKLLAALRGHRPRMNSPTEDSK